MNKLSLMTFALLNSLLILKGGEPEQRPVPPYVAPVKDNAEWVLKIAQVLPPDPAPSADVLKEIRLTKVGNLRRAILVATDETTLEFYHINGYHLSPATGQPILSQEGPLTEPYPYYSKGYYGVDWIKPEFYKGIVDYKSIQCFHYQGNDPDVLAEERPPEAWIECKTGLPMAVSIDGNRLEFIHYPAPAKLAMSDAYDRVWKIQTSQLSKISSMRVER